MAKKIIKQYYYKPNEIKGWINEDINKDGYKQVIENDIVNSNYYITQVGIQGLPGVKFHFGSWADDLILNGLGYFDLDLTNTGAYINNVYIDIASAISRANNNPKGYLIIDLILQTEDSIQEEEGGKA